MYAYLSPVTRTRAIYLVSGRCRRRGDEAAGSRRGQGIRRQSWRTPHVARLPAMFKCGLRQGKVEHIEEIALSHRRVRLCPRNGEHHGRIVCPGRKDDLVASGDIFLGGTIGEPDGAVEDPAIHVEFHELIAYTYD